MRHQCQFTAQLTVDLYYLLTILPQHGVNNLIPFPLTLSKRRLRERAFKKEYSFPKHRVREYSHSIARAPYPSSPYVPSKRYN